jgi:hypothetical protein
MRAASPKNQPAPRSAAATVQRSAGTVVQRDAGPAAGSGGKASSQARAGALAGVDVDELVGLVSRRLRAEFRIDRERFGRLRDSAR